MGTEEKHSQDAAAALLAMSGNNQSSNNGDGPPNPQPNLFNPPATLQTAGEIQQLILAMTTLMQQNAAMMAVVNQNMAQQQQPQQLYNVLPDLSHNIADFDGLSGPSNAKAWLKQLESTANLHRWTQAIAFETARSHLTKAAKNWYLANIDTISDWNSFRKSFASTFMLEKTLTERWQEMQSRNQRQGENTVEYFFDKLRLCKALNMGLDEIKTQIAVGLWSKEISTAIMSRTHFDTDELLRNITELEGLETARRLRINMSRDVSRNQRGGNHFVPGVKGENRQGQQRESDKQSSEKVSFQPGSSAPRIPSGENVSNSRVCYRCNNSGHLAKNCPVPREVKCYQCGEVGHISKNCSKPKSMSSVNVNVIENDSSNNSIKKYEKCVSVNKIEVIALIDPGSSECLIRESVVKKSGFKFIKHRNEIEGFGGGGTVSDGYVLENLVVDGCRAIDVRFRVVNDNVQQYDVIIGRNFTDLPQFAYYRVDGNFVFISREEFPFQNFPEINVEHNQKTTATVLEDTCLPRATVSFIRVNCNEQELSLPVTNHSLHDVIIKKGSVLQTNIVSFDEVPKLKSRYAPITEEDLMIQSSLDSDRKIELLTLLNKYRPCFAMNVTELGCTHLLKMDIQLKPGSEPPYSKPYPTNNEKREIIKDKVREWKENKIVKETSAAYASPCVLIMKSDGTHRLVIDYRKLNNMTVRMNFPLPNIDDGLEKLHGATIFAILDFALGYLQMPLTDEAKEKTAFITQDETGQFERAIFGLMNAPFYFAKLMKMIFGPYGNDLAITYFDDILVHAKSFEELLLKIERILILLKDAGLTLNLKKCRFGLEAVEYLGFTIGKGGMQPGEKKILAILEFPTPKNTHEVRAFVGLTSFFRRFIPGFAKLIAPLIALFKKDVIFTWGEDQQRAFSEAKEKMSTRPILTYYNPLSPRTELHTDACKNGLGAMLLQEGDDKQLHLVYAISRRTSDVEKDYHSTKLELMAIVWAMERLEKFLIGIQFRVVTDCQALIHINKLKTKNPQVVRWLNSLSEFDFEICHRPGDKMRHVDALSRGPVEDASEDLSVATVLNTMIMEEEIVMYQRNDELLARKIEILEKSKSKRTRREEGEVKDYVLRNGILYKLSFIDKSKELYVVPRAMRKAIVLKSHDLSSHFGIDRTVARINEHYYFPKMRKYVRNHIGACVECLFAKHKAGRQPGELHPIPPGRRPFAVVHLDHLGPFVTSARGSSYILAAICNLTKFVQLYAVKNTKANTTIRKVKDFIMRFGAPERIVTDRGTCFTADLFSELCNSHGIRLTLNSSRHAQANGQVERLNQTILPALQSNLRDFDGRRWDENLGQLERDLNTTICKTTGRTPFEMLFGYIPRFYEGLSRDLTLQSETYKLPNEIRESVYDKVLREQNASKERYDRSRLKNVSFKKGDIVVVKSNKLSTGESRKLQFRNKGPMVIIDTLPSDTYYIQNLVAKGKIHKGTTAHVSQLKIWRGHDDEDSSEDDIECELPNDVTSLPVNVNSEKNTATSNSVSTTEEKNVTCEEKVVNEIRDENVRRGSRIRVKPVRYGYSSEK